MNRETGYRRSFERCLLPLVAVMATLAITGCGESEAPFDDPRTFDTAAPQPPVPPRPVTAPSMAEPAKGSVLPSFRSSGPPNIVVIWGDDIGQSNLSTFTDGLMGYRTPNIDRIADEGLKFTDYYAEQSCTAGRSAFITGQSVYRTGLSKVGLPAAKVGLSADDPTLASLLKDRGYATGQFGKNHLGDRNEYLPTVHGFDEFYGNLYHLNAEEEPELPDYPKDPAFRARYGPRGVLDCVATDTVDTTVDPRFGEVGKQRCTDTGPLTRKRMQTIDDDVARRAVDYIERQAEEGGPFFVWVNFTHMHFRTHAKPESLGQAGANQSPYHDTMIDHDRNVGQILDKLDALGLTENTIVMYGTDNGPHMNTWPDGAMTPFRGEKNSGWEGAFRVPVLIRWPGKIQAGTVSNQIASNLDWVPTFLAAAGDPDIKQKLLEGHRVGDRSYKVHLDGYDQLPYLTGQVEEGPRKEFFYFSDDGDLMGLRYNNWKMHFMVQTAPGTMEVWAREFERRRIPYIYNLRTDPYERATITSNTYWDWLLDHAFLLVPAQDYVARFMSTFREFPPRQKAPSFSVDAASSLLEEPVGS